MMEKNGAITGQTPQGCGPGCGCKNLNPSRVSPIQLSKAAQAAVDTPIKWPSDKAAADAMEGNDLTKQAADAVKNASNRS